MRSDKLDELVVRAPRVPLLSTDALAPAGAAGQRGAADAACRRDVDLLQSRRRLHAAPSANELGDGLRALRLLLALRLRIAHFFAVLSVDLHGWPCP